MVIFVMSLSYNHEIIAENKVNEKLENWQNRVSILQKLMQNN
jgi:hypothetical protein